MKKIVLTTTALLTTLNVSAFNNDPGVDDIRICEHVHENGYVDAQYAFIPTSQTCPSYTHSKHVNGVLYTIFHNGSAVDVHPKTQDVSNPTCFNQHVDISAS